MGPPRIVLVLQVLLQPKTSKRLKTTKLYRFSLINYLTIHFISNYELLLFKINGQPRLLICHQRAVHKRKKTRLF